MIKEYYRPKTVSEAERLFAETDKKVVPLGGGSVLSRSKQDAVCVVDLRDLGLDRIEAVGHKLTIGATTTLQQLLDADPIPEVLKGVIKKSASLNVRNQATIAGYVVSAGGRAPLAIALMAVDAQLLWHPHQILQPIGDWFSLRRTQGYWIKEIQLNLNVELGYEQVARTPMDQPILAVALARWRSGRVRVVVGGFGEAPLLAFDGLQDGGVLEAVKNALSDSGDEWASTEYRMDVGQVLVRRILDNAAQGT
jgi:CO/xanthine dehydrogenase FAD-binding subunit